MSVEYFVARTTRQEGPLSREEVASGLAQGRFKPSELCWSSADSLWLPLVERREFERQSANDSPPATMGERGSPSAQTPASREESGPPAEQALLDELPPNLRDLPEEQLQIAIRASIAWRRFAARLIDIEIAAVIGFLIFLLFRPGAVQNVESWPLIALYATALWVWIEAALLLQYGATPGKMVLKLRVETHNGERPSMQQAITRSLMVWILGKAMDLPILSMVAMFLGLRAYLSHGTNVWDRAARTRVIAEPISRERGRLVMIIIIAMVVGSMMTAMTLSGSAR